jgi:DNA-binding response OmpR family regulator
VPQRILVVEDDATIAAALADRLRAEGFEAEVVGDGLAAVARAEELLPDLVLLDVMLPGLDGLEVCRRLQARRYVPVLMLTARDDETDVLVGLGVGADDYITKPFSMREVVARVRAVLRRAEAHLPAEQPVRVGDLVVDSERRQVVLDDRPVMLTPTEFDLLLCLARRPGVVLRRDQLLAEVWGYRDAGGSRTVDSHVRALRRKLRDDLIRTVHGVGYALDAEAAG